MSRRKQRSTISHGTRLRGQSPNTKPLVKYINDTYGPKTLGFFYVTSNPEEAGAGIPKTIKQISGKSVIKDFGTINERYKVLEWSDNLIDSALEWSENNNQSILIKSSKPINIPEKYKVIDDCSFWDVIQDDSGLKDEDKLIFNLTYIPIIIPTINQKTGNITYETDSKTKVPDNFQIPAAKLNHYLENKYYIESNGNKILYPYFPFKTPCVIITQTYGSQDLINVFYPKLKIYSINSPDYSDFNLATINCSDFNDSRWWDSGLINRPIITILPRLKPEPYKPGRKATVGEEKDFDNLKTTCINFKTEWPGTLSSYVLKHGILQPNFKLFLGDMFKKVSFKGYTRIVCLVSDNAIKPNLQSFFEHILEEDKVDIQVVNFLEKPMPLNHDLAIHFVYGQRPSFARDAALINNSKTLFISFSLYSPISSHFGATLTMLLRHLYITHKSIKDPKFRSLTGMEVGPKDDKDWVRRYRNYILKMNCELALSQLLYHFHSIPNSDLLFLGTEPECDYIRARLASKKLKAVSFSDLTSLNSDKKVVDYGKVRGFKEAGE